jgi:protein-S-isoprenylcysteine O-methyltransferase Ste14
MLKDQMIRHGNWLFRWRSYLPIILVPVALVVFQNAGWMTQLFGDGIEDAFDDLCLLLAVAGLAIRVATVGFAPEGTSGRNTKAQKARVLNTTGLYSLVRHPLYFGNFLVFLAFVLLFKSLVFTLFASVLYCFYYERIMLAEEQFLEGQYGAQYRAWAAAVPAVIPRFGGWKRPALTFSWRSALLREFHTVFLVAAVFFLVEMAEALAIDGLTIAAWMREEPLWTILLLTSAALYAVVMAVKKFTTWLVVAGR